MDIYEHQFTIEVIAEGQFCSVTYKSHEPIALGDEAFQDWLANALGSLGYSSNCKLTVENKGRSDDHTS